MKKHVIVIAVVAAAMSANIASALDGSFVNALPIVDKAPSQAGPSGSSAAPAAAVLRDKWRQWSAVIGTMLGTTAPETETASCPICPVPPCN